jgi:hypothetical protein
MLKTIFIVLGFVLYTSTTIAQFNIPTTSSNPYTARADQVFSALDKNDIPTDILYDRVFPYANLRVFNQTSADTSKTSHFYIAYAELQQADYSDRWNSVNTIKNTIEGLPGTQIPIGFINVDKVLSFCVYNSLIPLYCFF